MMLIVSLSGFSQSVKISNSSVKYDENLSPYITLNATNSESSRTVTTIVFNVWYQNNKLDMFDIDRAYCESVTVRANIGPGQTTSLTFYIPNGKQGFKPNRIDVSKVRFSDGTMKEF